MNTSETKPSPLTRLERELLSALRACTEAAEGSMYGRVRASDHAKTALAKAEKQDADFDAYIDSAKEVNDANHYAHLDGMHQTPQAGCPTCGWEARHADDGESVGGRV